MAIIDQERDALLSLLVEFDHDDLATFLGANGLPQISVFSSPAKRMPVIALDFLTWLNLHPDNLQRVFTALSTEFAATDEAPVLAAAAARIAAIPPRPAGPPQDVRLAGGVPIVNRSVLREYLRLATNGAGNAWSDIKVVSIVGERGLGRTHSWHLIKFVADSGVAKAIKIDLVSATLENQTLEVLFKQLVRTLKITDAEKPTSDGVTSDTLAARYAEELAGCLGRVTDTWPKPVWLVFDSLDRDVRPEIKRFISLLSRARLDGMFGQCVLFLLGPDATSQPDDPARVVLTEPLVMFNDSEIRDAATCVNNLGAAQLAMPDLEDRISQMIGPRSSIGDGEFCQHVATRLVDLRIEVRA